MKLKDNFEDPYGNIFKKGQFVLQGKLFLGENIMLIRHINLMKSGSSASRHCDAL